MGFYKDVLKWDGIPDDWKIRCLYGIRDHRKVVQRTDVSEGLSDYALYYSARSYAALGDYRSAYRQLNMVSAERSLYSYYRLLYSMLAGIIPEVNDILSIDNLYYRGKLIERMFELDLDPGVKESLYRGILNEKFISSRIFNRFSHKYSIDRPPGFEHSIYRKMHEDIYKSGRTLKHSDIFYSRDRHVNIIQNINPYILYNEIMLTETDDKEKLVRSFFEKELPYHGLRYSWKLKSEDKIKYIYPMGFYRYVTGICRKEKVDPLLIFAIMREESSFRWGVSERGASGLMQLMPSTEDWMVSRTGYVRSGNRLYDNIYIGVLYVRYLLEKYSNLDNPYIYAIISYNAGPGNLDKWIAEYGTGLSLIDNIPYYETERYLFKVFRSYVEYIRLYDKSDKEHPSSSDISSDIQKHN
ncbi:MAG: lytic transglycosylase domain-containing protein [Candidatus Muiribacteriaceae bacterium]